MRQLFLAFFIIVSGLITGTQIKGNNELHATLHAIGSTVLVSGFGLKALSSLIPQPFLKQALDIGGNIGVYTGAFMAVLCLATENKCFLTKV